MRTYIDLAEEVIDSIPSVYFSTEYPVYRNGSKRDLQGIFAKVSSEDRDAVRGLLCGDDLLFWSGFAAAHGGIKDRHCNGKGIHLLMHRDGVTVLTMWRYTDHGKIPQEEILNKIAENPNLIRIYGPGFRIINDDPDVASQYTNEDVQMDVDMHSMATKAAQMVMEYVSRGGAIHYHFIVGEDEYFAIKPEAIGWDKEFGIDHCLMMYTLSDPRSHNGLSGSYVRFKTPLDNHYTCGIVYECLPQLDYTLIPKYTYTTMFLEAVSHEFIHLMDDVRSNNKIFPADQDASKKREYYNGAAEFNAYFHGVASTLLHFIKDAKSLTTEEIRDVAEIYGIDRDFKATLRNLLSSTVHVRDFIKWLEVGNRKRLIARLYKLHQEVIKLLDGK